MNADQFTEDVKIFCSDVRRFRPTSQVQPSAASSVSESSVLARLCVSLPICICVTGPIDLTQSSDVAFIVQKWKSYGAKTCRPGGIFVHKKTYFYTQYTYLRTSRSCAHVNISSRFPSVVQAWCASEKLTCLFVFHSKQTVSASVGRSLVMDLVNCCDTSRIAK